jgi:hypothetical protein
MALLDPVVESKRVSQARVAYERSAPQSIKYAPSKHLEDRLSIRVHDSPDLRTAVHTGLAMDTDAGGAGQQRRKGTVLLDTRITPRATWEFSTLMVLLNGQWPPRGLVSGRWPPVDDDEGDSSMPRYAL